MAIKEVIYVLCFILSKYNYLQHDSLEILLLWPRNNKQNL